MSVDHKQRKRQGNGLAGMGTRWDGRARSGGHKLLGLTVHRGRSTEQEHRSGEQINKPRSVAPLRRSLARDRARREVRRGGGERWCLRCVRVASFVERVHARGDARVGFLAGDARSRCFR